jgi:hypothetical protein
MGHRTEFRLTAAAAPVELVRPVEHDEAMSEAIRDGMRAALEGNFSKLDAIEVAHLNVLVRVGALVVKERDGTPHVWFTRGGAIQRYGNVAPFVVSLHRGYTKDGRTALQWWLAEKCRRCDGKLRHLPCRVCGGEWYVADVSDWVLYTDLEGVLLEEGE